MVFAREDRLIQPVVDFFDFFAALQSPLAVVDAAAAEDVLAVPAVPFAVAVAQPAALVGVFSVAESLAVVVVAQTLAAVAFFSAPAFAGTSFFVALLAVGVALLAVGAALALALVADVVLAPSVGSDHPFRSRLQLLGRLVGPLLVLPKFDVFSRSDESRKSLIREHHLDHSWR